MSLWISSRPHVGEVVLDPFWSANDDVCTRVHTMGADGKWRPTGNLRVSVRVRVRTV